MGRRFFLLALLAGCDLPPLTGEDLFGDQRDAAVTFDAPAAAPDAAPDAPRAAPDAAEHDLAPTGCTPTSCPGDTFCDEGTRRCTPRTGDGILSGVVRDAACPNRFLDAQVGIAGRRQCSPAGKGMYFFERLPIGVQMKMAVARAGYVTQARDVVLRPGGNIEDVVLVPVASRPCDEPVPAVCQCTVPGCP